MEKDNKLKVTTITLPKFRQPFVRNTIQRNASQTARLRQKSSLPSVSYNTTQKCGFCQQLVPKVLYKGHFDSHPSKILDYLYLGSYANACKKQVH